MSTQNTLGSQASQFEYAYELILDQILRGRMPPGSAISRRGLASILNMGVQPTTEALQRLESEGLIESVPRVGTRVRLPSEQDIRGHYIVREALESQSARLFAEKSSNREREELAAIARRLDALYNARDLDLSSKESLENYWFEVHTMHSQFHMRIAECTGCQALCVAIRKNQILVLNWLYDTTFQPRSNPEYWHSKLIEALSSGSVDVADRTMREHTRYGLEEVLKRRERYSNWNKDYR
jgi:GntR family transcriptional regulator, rspAB operon transcriptional repressor